MIIQIEYYYQFMKPIIFGHRGVPTKAPENSLKGFSLLLKYNIPGVELDIHLTKDNKLVVVHDFNTERMTGKRYEISDTTYSKLSSLDIGEGEKIPLLKEVFELLGNNVIYDLEIKSRGNKRKLLVKKIIELIQECKVEKNVFISSFDPIILRIFNKEQKALHNNLDIKTGIIYSKDKDVPFILRSGIGVFITKNSIIKPKYNQLTGLLYYIYTNILKKKCYTWTVNTKNDYYTAIKRGATGICTNIPEELLKL